jgi:hypothetical protein
MATRISASTQNEARRERDTNVGALIFYRQRKQAASPGSRSSHCGRGRAPQLVVRCAMKSGDRDWLYRVIFGVGVVNFLSFVVIASCLGGDALNGKHVGAHYLLGGHGAYTEVSAAVFRYSQAHATSLFVTHPLAVFAAWIRALHSPRRRTWIDHVDGLFPSPHAPTITRVIASPPGGPYRSSTALIAEPATEPPARPESERLSVFERGALEKLLEGEHPVLAVLRRQLSQVVVTSRRDPAHGLLLGLHVPDSMDAVDGEPDLLIDDVVASVANHHELPRFTLTMRKGRLDRLEAVMVEERWLPDPERFSFDFVATADDPAGVHQRWIVKL